MGLEEKWTIRLRPGALAHLCLRLRASREQVARVSGLSSSTLYRIEREDTSPATETIAALLMMAKQADMTWEEMFEVVRLDD